MRSRPRTNACENNSTATETRLPMRSYLMINEPIEPSRARRSKALAQAARDRISVSLG
jgi:hypothetical protein